MDITFKASLIFYSSLFLFLFFTRSPKDKISILKIIYIYSGVQFLIKQFVITPKNPYPRGVIWSIAIYFATYAFTSQRFEAQFNKAEFQYTIYTTQIAARAPFSNNRLLNILKTDLPEKPYISNPITIARSFLDNLFPKQFYQFNKNSKGELYQTLSEFQQDIIYQWRKQLTHADFSNSILNGFDFSGADLESANFSSSSLNDAFFNRAHLKNANFKWAEINSASFIYTRNITAQQLISAREIFEIRCHPDLQKEIQRLGFAEMLFKKTELDFSPELRELRFIVPVI